MKVYFAHPCFNEAQKAFKTEFVRKLCTKLMESERGKLIDIIDPFKFTPNIEGDLETKRKMSKSVKTTCLNLLEDCDVIIALVDDNDMGTAFEAGYAHSLNKPIVLISQAACDKANAMLIGAAKASFDNILDDGVIGELAAMLEWFYVSQKRFPPTPGHN
jgi:nucleoside 2-deoxyribosyltransferase